MSVSLCYRAFDTLGLFHALLCKWRLWVVPGILITSGSQTDSCLWGIVLPHLCNVFCVCGTFHSVSQSSLWALNQSCGIPSWRVLYCIYAFMEGWASICSCLMCAEVTLVSCTCPLQVETRPWTILKSASLESVSLFWTFEDSCIFCSLGGDTIEVKT